MKIKRLRNANEPNINTGSQIIGLEEALKEYIKNNHVVIDDNDSIYDKAFNKNNPCVLLPIINPSRVIGIVTDVDDEYFYVDLTSFGEEIIGDNANDKFKIGVVSQVDKKYLVDEDCPSKKYTQWYCKRIIRLYLCNTPVDGCSFTLDMKGVKENG